MSQLEADAKPRAATGKRVKAVSRASGSAKALALTRETGAATVKKGRRNPSTSNTVAELVEGSSGQATEGSDTVVRTFRPRTTPCSPRTRIRRATVQRATSIPSRPSCRQIFRIP